VVATTLTCLQWFANTEILIRDAGVANERAMFNLFRGASTSSQANTWAKFLYDTALTSSPYTHVKNALIKRYAHRAHRRLFEIHNLRLQDGESYSSFMDRLIHIAGHDRETNWYKRRELYNAFMNAVPDQLHWKLSGYCDTDLLDLATLADNILLDSKNRRNQHSDHSSNFSSSAFS